MVRRVDRRRENGLGGGEGGREGEDETRELPSIIHGSCFFGLDNFFLGFDSLTH